MVDANAPHERAAVLLACRDLTANQAFFTALGFRLDVVVPADDPRCLILSGHGLVLRLVRAPHDGGGALFVPGAPPSELTAPNGATIQVGARTIPTAPAPRRLCIARADASPWHEGRAGMQYRDLIPGRLGGAVIASRIRIARGGPVPDYVHHHAVAGQAIYCRTGSVRVVYEDQGEAIVMQPGDCVLQPPGIRHRVLDCRDGLEVIEIAAPAEHATFVDHDLDLPTARVDADRVYAGQRFCWHRAPSGLPRPDGTQPTIVDTGLGRASSGAIDVATVFAERGTSLASAGPNGIELGFVLRGSLELAGPDGAESVAADDAFAAPPGIPFVLRVASRDAQWLRVRLAAPLMAAND